MADTITLMDSALAGVVKAFGEEPMFQPNDPVRISLRFPVGHYRVPLYVRGKAALIEAVASPAAVNNEEEGFGRNAGLRRHYYRVSIPLTELWPGYAGSLHDGLHIEIFEDWLEGL